MYRLLNKAIVLSPLSPVIHSWNYNILSLVRDQHEKEITWLSKVMSSLQTSLSVQLCIDGSPDVTI